MKKTKIIYSIICIVLIWSCGSIFSVDSSLPQGNGVQKINPHIHEDLSIPPYPPYARGYYYVPLLPDLFSGTIPTGTWLTIGFGWGYKYVFPEDIDARKAELVSTAEEFEIYLSFDGINIDKSDCWRYDDIVIREMEDLPGTFLVYLPFRYYLPPQSIGYYPIIITYGDLTFSGWVEWVPVS
ncbi:MAG: hypothetical protein ACFFAJ_15760 [Candidatus Hodarchaeota archaeon]